MEIYYVTISSGLANLEILPTRKKNQNIHKTCLLWGFRVKLDSTKVIQIVRISDATMSNVIKANGESEALLFATRKAIHENSVR